MPRLGEQQRAIRRREIVTAIDGIVLDDDPTSYNSAAIEADPWTNFLLFLSVLSSGTPTTVQFVVQFSDDGGTTWYDYVQGLFASLFYEDTDTASVLTECFSGKVHGHDMRVRAVGTGTDGTDKFTISAKVELWS